MSNLPADIRAHAAQAAGILLALANGTDPIAASRSVINQLMSESGRPGALAMLADIEAGGKDEARATMAGLAAELAETVAEYFDADDSQSPGMDA